MKRAPQRRQSKRDRAGAAGEKVNLSPGLSTFRASWHFFCRVGAIEEEEQSTDYAETTSYAETLFELICVICGLLCLVRSMSHAPSNHNAQIPIMIGENHLP